VCLNVVAPREPLQGLVVLSKTTRDRKKRGEKQSANAGARELLGGVSLASGAARGSIYFPDYLLTVQTTYLNDEGEGYCGKWGVDSQQRTRALSCGVGGVGRGRRMCRR